MPFRIGHHFASKLTDYGRGKGLKLQEIPFAEVQRIYSENANAPLPLQENEYREIISAETMVFGRKGLGGPQPQGISHSISNAKQLITDLPKTLTKRQLSISNQLQEKFLFLFT